MTHPAPRACCAVITGASSGLGREFALQVATFVKTLVIVARREELLHELAAEIGSTHPEVQLLIYSCDLTQENERHSLHSFLETRKIHPDLLVNNAGMGDYGEFRTSDWPKTRQMLQLNIEALTHLTHLFTPSLISQKGSIINLSSLAGDLPIPDFAVYAASKAYVTSFSEAIRIELQDHGVRVLAVCPGPVKTGFGEAAKRATTTKLPVQEAFYVPAKQVVSESLRALSFNRPRTYPGLKVAAAATLVALLPLALIRLTMSQRPRRSE